MKVYKITWENGTDERSVRWEGTQEAVAAFKKQIPADSDPEVEQVDIPYEKPKLLDWLNANSRGGKEYQKAFIGLRPMK